VPARALHVEHAVQHHGYVPATKRSFTWSLAAARVPLSRRTGVLQTHTAGLIVLAYPTTCRRETHLDHPLCSLARTDRRGSPAVRSDDDHRRYAFASE